MAPLLGSESEEKSIEIFILVNCPALGNS